MSDIARNPIIVIERVIGNLEAFAATLEDINGNAIDLTGRAVVFRMVNMSTGLVKVNNAAATVVTPASGKVSYTPVAADVDTAGRYAGYFIDNATPARRWPYDGARYQINVKSEITT